MSYEKSDATIEAGIEAKKSKSHGRSTHLGLDAAGGGQHPAISPIEEKRARGGEAATHDGTVASLSNKAAHGISPSLRDRTVLAKHKGLTGGAKVAHGAANELEQKAKEARLKHTADVDINVR